MSEAFETAEKIVQENINLVHSIIKRYQGRGVDYDDLFQIGSIGLLNATRRFNPTLGYQFSTYATSLIIGEIKRYFRDDGTIKVSRHLKEISHKINKLNSEFAAKNSRDATISELSELSGINIEDITAALTATEKVRSIDSEIYEGVSIADFYAVNSFESERIVDKVLIESFLNKLSERDSKIIKYRYFMDKTQKETAKLLGISQVQVSRIEKSVLCKMRNACR